MYDPLNLGSICKFKWPDEYKTGKILVQHDNKAHDPYIKKWQMPIPEPTDAELTVYEQEMFAAQDADSTKQAERDAAEARLRAPYGQTSSVQQLRTMVDDIVIYLGLT